MNVNLKILKVLQVVLSVLWNPTAAYIAVKTLGAISLLHRAASSSSSAVNLTVDQYEENK